MVFVITEPKNLVGDKYSAESGKIAGYRLILTGLKTDAIFSTLSLQQKEIQCNLLKKRKKMQT